MQLTGISFKHRNQEKEMMDDFDCQGQVVEKTLGELKTINRLLGGNRVTIKGLKKLVKPTGPNHLRIGDLGCGGGDMLKLIAAWAEKKGINVELIGFDANPHILEYARKNCREFPQISFSQEDVLADSFKDQKLDILICTLFLHHFEDNEVVRFIKNIKDQVRIGIVINDLHRHWFAYYAILFLTFLFSRSKMVKHDGPLSVLKAFARIDLERILKESGIASFKLYWRWAFRWELVIGPM